MLELKKQDYSKALALFRNSRHQMRLAALAQGGIEGAVWADAETPRVAVALYQNKLLAASELPVDELAALLKPFLQEQVYYGRMGCGANEALMFWDGEGAHEALLLALAEKHPAEARRAYYELDDPAKCRPANEPEGYTLRHVDAALLSEGLGNTEELEEEMRSERVSVEAFLAGSFGVAAVYEGRLAGWCLSEYNCSMGCEVGIGVAEDHRRRGVARMMVAEFAAEAARRGVQRVGWHCFHANAASSATALSAGFRKVLDYGELLCFFEPAVQFAVNGNFSDGAGRYEEAVGWYGQAVALNGAPLWVYVRLAMAETALGRFERAFGALEAGRAKGFNGWGWLRAEPRLEPLRGEERWRQLF